MPFSANSLAGLMHIISTWRLPMTKQANTRLHHYNLLIIDKENDEMTRILVGNVQNYGKFEEKIDNEFMQGKRYLHGKLEKNTSG